MSPIPQIHLDTVLTTASVEAWKVVLRGGGWGYIDVEDLFQVGCMAGLEAYDRWDETKGTFRTYATHRIRGGIKDYLRQLDPMTRRERIEVKAGLRESIFIFSWEDYDDHDYEVGYENAENDLLIKQALSNFHGEAHAAVVAWVRMNGNCTQREIANIYGINEAAVSRGIKQLLSEAKSLVERE